MKPGDLVRVRDFMWSWSGHRIGGILCFVVEVIPNSNVCIVLCQNREWAALEEQLEVISEAG